MADKDSIPLIVQQAIALKPLTAPEEKPTWIQACNSFKSLSPLEAILQP